VLFIDVLRIRGSRDVIATGQDTGWNDLAMRVRRYVERRAPSTDVDDVVQDVMLRIHRGLASNHDGRNFSAWIYGITKHALADRSRTAKRHPSVSAPAPEQATVPVDDDLALQAELAACAARFIAQLPSPYREAVTLTELEGLPQVTAAELVGVSLSAMKSRVQRGRERLRTMFEECCEITVDCRGHVTDCAPRSSTQKP
jgi:RNA polymerase sigma-70 factor (ECF subfamily)